MGFNATSDIEPFDFNLRPYVDASGTIPEPSDEQVREFYAGIGNILTDVLGEDRIRGILADEAEYAAFLERKPEALIKIQAATNNVDDMAKAQERMTDLHAAVCGGTPSRDELAALPYRVKQALYGALQRWLSPEASRPAGNA